MLIAVAFVPSAPLLLDALGGGPSDLRTACQQAISVLGAVEQLVVVGGSRGGLLTGVIDPTPYGAPGPPATHPLPLPHAVGATLLGDRLALFSGSDLPDVDGDVGLLVVGDGSARRTEKAPGHLDPRAESFDADVEEALRRADLDAVLALDDDLALQLLVGGVDAWKAAAAAARREVGPGGAAPDGWRGTVHYAAAPYGVGYFVASWTP